MSKQVFYKALNEGGFGPYTHMKWSLPTNGKPGEWMPRVKVVAECASGYHVCRRVDLIEWLRNEIYKVEVRGYVYKYNSKCAVHEARLTRRLINWTKKTRALFAADCAERILPDFELKFPEDPVPRARIVSIRRYALCEISLFELTTNNNALPATVTYVAAHSATLTAVHTHFVATDSTAQTAIHATAGVKDCAAERRWQTKTLFQYLNRPVSESLDLAREKLRG